MLYLAELSQYCFVSRLKQLLILQLPHRPHALNAATTVHTTELRTPKHVNIDISRLIILTVTKQLTVKIEHGISIHILQRSVQVA